MNFQGLEELQSHLLNSDHRKGIEYNRTFLADMYNRSRPSEQPEMEQVDPIDYMHRLGETYVLANYIQTAYQQRLAIGEYQEQDKPLNDLLSNIQTQLKKLAHTAIENHENEQGELQVMIDSPQNYYSEITTCQEVESTLDSLARFRLAYPIPFDKADPENIRHLYRLYQDVANMDVSKLSDAEQREKAQWLDWASADFTPLSNTEKIKQAEQKNIEDLALKAVAFQKGVPAEQTAKFPPVVQESLATCAQAIDQLVRNIEVHFQDNDYHGNKLPILDPKLIKQAITWLQEPERQPTLFSTVKPPEPSPYDGSTASTITRNPITKEER